MLSQSLGLSLLFATVSVALDACPSRSDAEYDFVILGAGTGGGVVGARLADAGFTVLGIDAGHEVNNYATSVPLYLANALDDPEISLNYELDFYPSGFSVSKDNAWYPRARGLGGCTLHNALINLVDCTMHDFNDLADTFNDDSFSFDSMWEYFKLLEDNHYIEGSSDHGYDGWLDTNANPLSIFEQPAFADPQFSEIFNELIGSYVTVTDINSKAGNDATGISTSSNTETENYERATVRPRIVGSAMNLLTDTLVTKILLCDDGDGPVAYGAEVAEGAALPIAANFDGKGNLDTREIIAGKEVILAAGVFQSPQIMMLSGLGPTAHLTDMGIDTVVDIPGVGQNLQDHDEVSSIWLLQDDHVALQNCSFGLDPAEDPCLAQYEETHLNIYSFGPALAVTPYYYDESQDEPDMLTYWTPGHFSGFIRGVQDDLRNYKNAITAVTLRAHPSSRGYVQLTGSDPQDTLEIQKNQFQNGAEGEKDLAAMVDGIKRTREVFAGNPNIAQHIESEYFPGEDKLSDSDLEGFVYDNIFGHHACCTNKMGADDDEDAVLDGDFKVRGVADLRIIDMSTWRNVPGFFPATPMMILAEKAAAVIIDQTTS